MSSVERTGSPTRSASRPSASAKTPRGVLLALWAAAWGLAAIMPAGLASLIVAVVVGVVAAGAIVTGRKRRAQVDLTPRATLESVQRDQHVIAERSPR